MTNAETVTQTIRVEVEQKPSGMFYAGSPDLRGLIVAKRSLKELEAAIPAAVSAHYEYQGLKVISVVKVGAGIDKWDVTTSEVLASAH